MKKFIGFLSVLSVILGACAADSPDVIGTSFEMTIAVMAGCFILAAMLGLIAYILPEKKKHRWHIRQSVQTLYSRAAKRKNSENDHSDSAK